jgi:hypothetical protein
MVATCWWCEDQRCDASSPAATASLSGRLYFRGKLAYAEAFARPPLGLNSGAFVITPKPGLLGPSQWEVSSPNSYTDGREGRKQWLRPTNA